MTSTRVIRVPPDLGFPGGHIVVGGKRLPCKAAVYPLGSGSGREFGEEHTGLRRAPPSCIVLHWTGAERTPPSVYKNLRQNGLSIDFVIAKTGVIHQFADPDMRFTFHAGGPNAIVDLNEKAVGVEIVNYGFQEKGKKIPHGGRERPTYETTLNGKRRTLARYYPPQLQAVAALIESLRKAFPAIPAVLPSNRGRLATDRLSATRLRSFKGVLGHYHAHRYKLDPGTDVLEMFLASGYRTR